MSALEQEIASQPQMWRTAAAMGAEAREALPAAGARIAVVGCGTSWFMAQSVAALREAGGLGETDAFTPTEMPPGRAPGHAHRRHLGGSRLTRRRSRREQHPPRVGRRAVGRPDALRDHRAG